MIGKGTTSVVPSSLNQNLVIPNRAESPVRNLLFVDATTNPRCPIDCPERSRRVSLLLRDVGFHELVPLRILGAPRPGRARLQSCRHSDKTHTARKTALQPRPRSPKNLVIPNRAESPVRNLLYADATTDQGCPSFAYSAKGGIPRPRPSGNSGDSRDRKAGLQLCRRFRERN